MDEVARAAVAIVASWGLHTFAETERVAFPPKRDIYAGFDAARLAALTLYAEPYGGSYVRVSAAFSLARG